MNKKKNYLEIKVIQTFEYELTKVTQATYGTLKMPPRNSGGKNKRHKVSCNKVKVDKDTFKCVLGK